MKALRLACVIGAIAIVGPSRAIIEAPPEATPPNAAAEAVAGADLTGSLTPSALPAAPSEPETLPSPQEQVATDTPQNEQAKLDEESITVRAYVPDPTPPKRDLSYLVYYAYAEIPPDDRPADLVLDSLKDVPVGTPLEEIKRASDVFGLDFNFMKAVAKIESGFDPKQRTGSYIGLFQLSKYEFAKYGSGNILNPRDNAIAAAYKFLTEGILFEWEAHKKPTLSDLYLIHQQGWQGAAEHISHPERIAWKSMCATEEGVEKGEKWCRRAIWGNTLPTIKNVWKSVEKLTSSAFVDMWRDRVAVLYARYSQNPQTVVEETKHAPDHAAVPCTAHCATSAVRQKTAAAGPPRRQASVRAAKARSAAPVTVVRVSNLARTKTVDARHKAE